MIGHLRIARATPDLNRVVAFYRDVLGFELLASFHDHEGFDGAMLGQRGHTMHFEFTNEPGVEAPTSPSPETLVVLYLTEVVWLDLRDRCERANAPVVPAYNPYWDRNGVTIEDPDGYRIVLYRGEWRL